MSGTEHRTARGLLVKTYFAQCGFCTSRPMEFEAVIPWRFRPSSHRLQNRAQSLQPQTVTNNSAVYWHNQSPAVGRRTQLQEQDFCI